MEGVGEIPFPQVVLSDSLLQCNDILLQCHHKDAGVRLLLTGRDTLAAWHTQQHRRLGSRLGPQVCHQKMRCSSSKDAV